MSMEVIDEMLGEHGERCDPSIPKDGHCLHHPLRTLGLTADTSATMMGKAINAADPQAYEAAAIQMGRPVDRHSIMSLLWYSGSMQLQRD
eukprot:4545106-Pyramimonas_sp.AAC.1